MSTTATEISTAPAGHWVPPRGARWVVIDAWQMMRRNLVHTVRQPELIVFSTIQPVMFVLLFRYVFGGAINTGVDYANFLMPGIFVQTTVFGSMMTGMGLAYDLSGGMVDRFRSLPMSRSAVLLGRTFADTVRNLLVLLLMLAVGFLVGFRPHGGVGGIAGAIGIILVFGFAFCWVSAFVGISIRNPEAVQSAGFIWVFPLTFVSSAFVTTTNMPTWLADFARVNPFTITVNAARQLFLGDEAKFVQGLGTDVTGNVVASLLWVAGLLVVFIALSVRRYQRA